MEYSSLSALLGLDSYSPEQEFQYASTGSQPPTDFTGQQQFASREWPESPSSSISGTAVLPRQDGIGMSQTTGLDGVYGGVPGAQALFGGSTIGIQQGDMPQQQPSVQQVPIDGVSNSYPSPGMQYPPIRPSSQASTQQQQARPPPQASPQQQQFPQSLQQIRGATPKAMQSQVSSTSVTTTTAGTSPGAALSRNLNNSVNSLVSPPSSDSNSPTDTGVASTTTAVTNAKSTTQTVADSAVPESKAHLSYMSVTKAYDYTESYHVLMKFLPKRCVVSDQPDISAN